MSDDLKERLKLRDRFVGELRESLTYETVEAPISGFEVKTVIEESTGEEMVVLFPTITALVEGMSLNYRRYTQENLKGGGKKEPISGAPSGYKSFVKPNPVPVLWDHNMAAKPLGRMPNDMKAVTYVEENGLAQIEVTPKIIDKEAITGIREEVYTTVSIGAASDTLKCSKCGMDWKNPEEFMKCEHYPGRDGMHFLMDNVYFKELSFVNNPGVTGAKVKDTGESKESVVTDEEKKIVENTNAELVENVQNAAQFDKPVTKPYNGHSMDRVFRERNDQDAFYNAWELVTEFDEAKLSTAQRKKLKGSQFCGPKHPKTGKPTFPVPDCPHASAAKRLIGRAKWMTASQRKSTLACVARKEKSMGCGTKSKEAYEEQATRIYEAVDALEAQHAKLHQEYATASNEAKEKMTDKHSKLVEMLTHLGFGHYMKENDELDNTLPGGLVDLSFTITDLEKIRHEHLQSLTRLHEELEGYAVSKEYPPAWSLADVVEEHQNVVTKILAETGELHPVETELDKSLPHFLKKEDSGD